MNKRLFSAVSALVMVLSMLSAFILPVGAANEELQALIDEYAKYDFNLFTEGEAMASLYARAQAADADGEALLAEAAAIEKKLKNSYPHLVPYAQKSVYAAFTDGVKDWAITCAADWRAAVAAKVGFAGETLHLTNNIDMENINVSPLCPTGAASFAGTLNGHGYAFLNLLIDWDLANGNHVGLIGYSSMGKVENLGLANGLVRAYGKQTTEAKVGGLMGEGDDVTLRLCWSAVDVDASEADGKGGQTVSGLARTRNKSVIDSCFSVGKVHGVTEGSSYAGTLSGYVQTNTKLYNCFALGTATGLVPSFIRYTADGLAVSNAKNCYTAGNTAAYCPKNVTGDLSAYALSAAAYSTGELAWKLNQGMEGDTLAYYTVKDGKTVFGTAENQTRRVSMVLEGGETKYVYGSAGEQVKLNYAIGASYEGEAEIVGNLLTMPDRDITVSVTLGALDYNALQIALAQYDGVYMEFIQNRQAVEELIEAVEFRMENGYADQESIDADTKALNDAFVYVPAEQFPSVKDYAKYPGFHGFSISSLEELEFAAKYINKLTADLTLYFASDIQVTEDSVANNMRMAAVSLDGMGHTISGLRVSGDAWLGDYAGKSVRNLTFKDCHATNQPWQGALLIKNLTSPELVLENLNFDHCSAASCGTQNGLSIVLGVQQKNNRTEMRNIRIENCTLERGTSAGNSGFLIGREHFGVLIAENCYLNNNTLRGTPSSGAGIAFGEVTGTASMKNIGIFNTNLPDKAPRGALIGAFKNSDDGKGIGILDFENIYSANNGMIGLVYRSNTTGVVTAGNAYSEGDGLLGVDTTGVTARESLVGGAYALNHAGVEKQWEFPAGGNAPVWDTDGKGLPVKVTFKADVIEERYFTDTEGKLLGLADSLFAYADWQGIKDLATLKQMTFTEDTVYEGTLGKTYTVMSQNLCVWGGDDKKPYMVERIRLYDPDFILMQEGNEPWIKYFAANLKDYTVFYQYRSDKESCPIAWKTEKFDVLEKGYFWISDTPDVQSLGWDGACYRIVTWAVLKDKTTGEQMIISSFHLDHQGKIAREKGGQVVYDRLLEIRERYPGSMFFTAADFNCAEGSTAYKALTQENLVDCRYNAVITSSRPTHSGLSPDWSGVPDSARIDFMMTDVSTAKVLEFKVLEEIYGVTDESEGTRISDHNGLLSKVVSMATEEAFCDHEWTVTDNGDGTHKRRCTAGCGYSADVAHSNRYTAKDGLTHATLCIYCGATGEEACDSEETVIAAPTCTTAGSTTYFCNDCKHTRTEETAPLPHTFVWDAEKADYFCNCGAVLTSRDANGDGTFNIADASVLMQYMVGKEVDIDLMIADYCRDNRISVADVVAVLRILAA
ncbi:MAG: hypothetical protein IJP27_07025 [Clostridia bacterium]|nr:hypothetical protein [Clostridia bacterium]